jgi:hypothetical protein
LSWLVVSDLHLGTRSGADLLARPDLRAALLEAVGEADGLVLLGDVVELREGSPDPSLARAREPLRALGDALGERPLLLVPGNHDHRLVSPWLGRRGAAGKPPPLGLEQRLHPAEASREAAAVADSLAPARVEVAYPGVWLEEGVYATHGHYLDRHNTVPAFEPLGVRAMERVVSRTGGVPPGPDGYEAVLGPLYGLLNAASRVLPAEAAGGASPSQRAYRALTAADGVPGPLPTRLLTRVGFPALVGALNAAGLGPLVADLSAAELRRAALRAMHEVVRGLEVDARAVLFGHTHRPGPLPRDDAVEWRGLHNSGSWVLEPFLLRESPEDSPYWPGGALLVDGAGEVRTLRLLADRSRDQLTRRPG